MRWVIATDAFGTGLALPRAPGHILIYPQSMIGKRWVEGETGFIVRLADFTAQRVAELARR